MSVLLTVKVDDELKAQATAVLEELGLDAPTAIRMYLKSIVRENGLPINTKLPAKPCCCASSASVTTPTAAEEESVPVATTPVVEEVEEPTAELTTPAVEEAEESAAEEPAPEAPVVIDYDTRAGRKAVAALFIDAICAVPEGKLTRWSDMEAKLSKEYGTEVKRPASIRWPATTADGVEIPYWRIVGERGAVRGDKMIDQKVQEEKLTAEGHTFESTGHGIFTGIKVEGYKEKLV